MSRQREDLKGRTFGRWVVLEFSGRDKNRNALYLCRCLCGQEKTVCRVNLLNGQSTSCGCYLREISTTHGGRGTIEWGIWSRIKQRCNNPRCPKYSDYGGRGIVLCDRWRVSFANFLADMGKRPSPEYSIDRIDNDGPYSPENCRWATRSEQGRNYRQNHLIEYQGSVRTLVEWSEITGIRSDTISMRLKKGWSVERALS
jgi:hypothetical protein